MKTAHKWLASILCVAMLLLVVSCGANYYIPTDSTIGSMSVNQAREALATQLKKSEIYNSGQPIPITNLQVSPKRLIVTDQNGKRSIFVYRELLQISRGLNNCCWVLMLNGQETFTLGHLAGSDGDNVVNAFFVLKQNAITEKKVADEVDSQFAASLTDYRKKVDSNAVLPEEASKYKVQAEGAVRDKEFDDAADLYSKALKIVPWWPVGHFNRALVLGETGDYELAKREMNYYQQLVPDAPNARAAQDKIYEWARLESKR